MTIGDWQKRNRGRLPEGETLLLLSFVLREDKAAILAHPERILSHEQEIFLDQCAERRRKNEPISSITGEKEFFGYPFLVTNDTLIPRPETEILIEQVLQRISSIEQRISKEKIFLIDIGTGSGCIPISILATLRAKNPEMLSHIRCLATDISGKALLVAKANAKRHAVADLISFREHDLLSHIPAASFHTDRIIITVNLPYLSKAIYDASPEDVRLYEPKSALQGEGRDGAALIRDLLNQFKNKTAPEGMFFLILEISPEQGLSLLTYGQKLFPQSHSFLLPDLSGKDRFLIVENSKE